MCPCNTVFCVLKKHPTIRAHLQTCNLWQCVHYANCLDPEVTLKFLDALCILTIATFSGHWSTRCHIYSGTAVLGISTSGSDDFTMWLDALKSRCCRLHSSRIPDGRRRLPQFILGHETSSKQR